MQANKIKQSHIPPQLNNLKILTKNHNQKQSQHQQYHLANTLTNITHKKPLLTDKYSTSQNHNQSKLSQLTEQNNREKDKQNLSKNPQNFLMNHKVLLHPFRYYEDAKFCTKSYGSIISYGVNTNQGQVRNYNEDRVSIILNVIKPVSRKNEDWPRVSFFGLFDGHGGTKCSDFLKENLHHYV